LSYKRKKSLRQTKDDYEEFREEDMFLKKEYKNIQKIRTGMSINNISTVTHPFDGQDRIEAGYDIKLDRDRI